MALVKYPTGNLFSDCLESGRRAATTCGNGIESFNVVRQIDVAIVNLHFFSGHLESTTGCTFASPDLDPR